MKARKKSTSATKARRKVVKKTAAERPKAKAKPKLPKRASVTKRGKAEVEKRLLVRDLRKHHSELQSQNVELQNSRGDVEVGLQSYADLYDYAPAGYLTLDRAGTIIQANLTAAVLLGCKRERLAGGRLALFVSPADRQRVNQLLRDLFESGKRQSCEVDLLAKNHPALVVHIEASLSSDGRQCRAVLVDVTALAQGRLALRESEERHRAVLQDQTEVIARFRADNTFTFVNDAFCRLFGKTSAELVGRVWQPVAVADDLPMIMERLSRLSPRNRTVVIENRVHTGTGEIRWMQFVNRAFFDKAGRLVETQSVGRDVTERKLAEEAMRESEERWKFALEGAGDGVWDWNVVTNHVVFSKRWKSMIGYEDDEIPNHFDEWSERVHPEDLPGAMAKVNALFDGSVPAYSCEFRMKCKDGSWKWILARGTVTSRDGEGRPLRAIGTHTDISDRKAAEEREARNLKLISEGAPCHAVLDAITRSVEAGHPGMLCSVMLVGPGRRHLLVGAAPSLPDYFCKALKGLIIGPDAACSGTAVYMRQRVIVEDILGDARWAPFAKLAARAKLRSCWAEPLIGHTGQILGAFACYHRQPHSPTPDEIAAVTAAAHLSAVAIEREADERSLKEGEERYRRIVQTTEEGIITIDSKARIDFVNPKMATMLGRVADEMIGRTLEDFMDEEGRILLAKYIKRRQQGISEQFEFKFLRKDGSALWTWISTNPIMDARGHYIGALAMVTDITTRKEAEAALVAERTRLRTVLDLLPISIYVKDTRSRFVVVNEGCAKALGAASREEMIGKTDADYFPPATAATFHGDELRVLAGEPVVDLEEASVAPDGTARTELTTKVPLRDEEGKVIGLVGVSRDITESKRADEAVRASEALLRSITDHTEDGIFVKDRESRTLFKNPAGLRASGLTLEQVLGRTDMEFNKDPVQAARFLADDRRVMETGETLTVEETLTSAAGMKHVLLTTKVPRFDEAGKIIGLVGVSRDITAQKLADAALHESEERYRLLAENTDDMVSLTDTKGHRLYLSPSYFRKTGWTPEDLLNRDWRTRVHPDDVEKVEAARKDNLAGKATRIEHRTSCKDGSWLWIEASSKPLLDSEGKVWRFLVWSHDITARREAEIAVRESEEKFRTLFENAGDAIFIMEGNQFVDCNARALEMFGCESRDQFVGHPPYEFSPRLQPGGRESIELAREKIAAAHAGEPQFFEWMHQRHDGTPFPAEVSLNTVKVRDKVFLQAFVRDISARRQAEELLAWEKGAMDLISSAASLREVLDGLTIGLEKQLPGALCSVLLLDEDGVHMRHGGAPSLPEAYNRVIDGAPIGPVAGSCGTAAYTRRQVIVPDIETDPLWVNYRELALGHGLRACWSTPIEGHEGKILGTFAIYYREPRHPTPVELEQVARATHVTRIAIERKLAETALRESEHRFRAIFEQAAVGVAMVDSNTGRFLSVNQRHREITRLSPEQTLAATFSDLTHPDDRHVDVENMKKLRAGAVRTLKVEKRYVHPDGTTTWVNVTVSPMWKPGEAPTTHIAVVEDITMRKIVEDALRKSEQKFRAIFEQAAVGVAMIDSQTGRFINVNQRHCDIARLTREEILGETFMNLTHPDDLQADLENMEKLKAGVIRNFAMEKRYLHPDGAITWIHLAVSPMWQPRETPTTHIAVVEDITARKRAERSLHESEERYRAIVESSTDYVLRYDRDGRHLFGNPAALKFTGLTYEQFVGKTHRELGYPPHLCDLWEKKIEQVFSTGNSVTIEFEVEGAEGKADLELKLSPEFASDGSVCGVVGVSRDVTERKKAAAALQRSEERYARAMRGSNDGLWDWFMPSRELYLSPRWKELLGFADDEVPNVEESFFSRIHPNDAEHVQDAINAHLEQHESYDVELRLRTKSGGYRWVRSRGEVEWDESGRATHMAGTITDITERKLAQERLAVEQEFNETLVANTSALIVVLNERSNIVHVNPAFVKELGYELSELAGRPLWESGMMSAPEIARSRERYRRLTEGLENPPTEVRLRAKNGDLHVVELTSIATRHADNSIDRIILTCTDITERTRLQHEVLKISEQEQASIGHNLHDGVGQTMTGIASMLEHLESTLSGDQQKIAARIRELMQDSVAEVRRMSHGLSPVAVQLRGLAGGLHLLAETIRTNYRAESTCEVDPGIVINDPEKETHLYRIAQEAINNALRHGRAKQVNIALKRVGDTECALHIEDNGTGMKKARAGNGHGVGLRVMQYRAGLIGGEVNVSSRLPSGVSIVCRFPCDCAPAPKKAKRAKSD